MIPASVLEEARYQITEALLTRDCYIYTESVGVAVDEYLTDPYILVIAFKPHHLCFPDAIVQFINDHLLTRYLGAQITRISIDNIKLFLKQVLAECEYYELCLYDSTPDDLRTIGK